MTSTFFDRYFIPNIFLLVAIISIAIAFISHPVYTKYARKHITNEETSLKDLLVTHTRPARTDNTLDFARCAALHNKLVEHAWVAEGREISDLERHSFFHHYGDQANEIRTRLDPALVTFLESIIVAEELPPFFFWVEGISPPASMFANHDTLRYDAMSEPGRFLVLYNTNPGLVGHAMGLIYDQQLHCATMALGIEDINFTQPVERHRQLWHPLETILSNWWHMVQIGKITASRDSAPNEKHGPWIWHSYGPMQVVSAIASFERLAKAIEYRISPDKLLPISDEPLLSHTDLDEASVPNPCFIRSFLSSVRRPRFDRIAPGLAIPLNPTVFVANQRYTTINISSEHGTIIPPVLIFASVEKRIVSLTSTNPYVSFNPFCRAFSKDVPSDGQSILSGLYSESVEHFSEDNAEEGFRLLLPFPLRVLGEEHGARKSDMNLVEQNSVADLFQHGFKPFGGEWWRAQRLEMLFDAWTHLVESGIWKVGDSGIEGNIDTFKEADRGRWADYRIDPSW
ncbi:hypothetical protein F4813DRAFT_274596 [Daldinia decipiens]|uniref:uncharacterized protein n=1 Tax=Daldinia decipiens TaxID=326647 RepID=UPI0020C1BDF5|nr:uncharacterized protein F4813DRAFT_274596 [Daldinia decipiens]KAI1653251.1 hypothetical protein F4813DRAFT_274596 [Daldinia decipiens]